MFYFDRMPTHGNLTTQKASIILRRQRCCSLLEARLSWNVCSQLLTPLNRGELCGKRTKSPQGQERLRALPGGSVLSAQVLGGEQPLEKCWILASVSECSRFSYLSPPQYLRKKRLMSWIQKWSRVGVDKGKGRSKTVQASAGFWVDGWRDIAIFNPWEQVALCNSTFLQTVKLQPQYSQGTVLPHHWNPLVFLAPCPHWWWKRQDLLVLPVLQSLLHVWGCQNPWTVRRSCSIPL